MKKLPTFDEMLRIFETLKKYRNSDGYVMRNREAIRAEVALERDRGSGHPLFHSILDGLIECGCIEIHKVYGQREVMVWPIIKVIRNSFTKKMYEDLTSGTSPLALALLKIKELEAENARLKARAKPSEEKPEN